MNLQIFRLDSAKGENTVSKTWEKIRQIGRIEMQILKRIDKNEPLITFTQNYKW